MAAPQDQAFLGQGWAYPLRLDAQGDFALSAGATDVREAVLIILGTALGERLMRPDFGAGLHRLVFEPISTTTLTLVRLRVQDALIAWEPRIDVLGVDVSAEPAAGRLLIEVNYRVRATNTFYNLVYPFYLLEKGPQ